MNTRRGIVQTTVYYLGYVCFMASIACLVYLFLRLDELGWDHVISASLAASAVFFASVGIVLIVIGKCDLPGFKPL